MKNLIITSIFFLISLISFSQTLSFSVKEYDLYTVNGYSEMDSIVKNTNYITEKCNRYYTINFDTKKVTFFENGQLQDIFKIENVIKNKTGIEVIVESYIDGYGKSIPTQFIIYLELKSKKVSNISFFWYNFSDDVTMVKKVN